MSDRIRRVLRDPKLDRILDSFAKRQRRLVLLTLRRSDDVHQSDLLVRGSDGDDAEIALVHTHLPKLEDAGYVEWDRETGTVSKGPQFDEVAPLIELIEDHADELPHGWP